MATADIVIEDRRRLELHSDRALGLGLRGQTPPDASALRSLIWCSITPFGQDGPWANYQATDLVGLALGGPMMMNGYDPEDAPGAPPIRGHGDQGYNTACHYAVQGILAALLYRDRTGAGPVRRCVDARGAQQHHRGGNALLVLQAPRTSSARPAGMRPRTRTEPWLYPREG